VCSSDLPLRDASLSTSSNAERQRLVDGRPAGHILDPRTGAFAAFRGSVTVLAPTGVDADALSTALFVDGPHSFAAGVSRRREHGVAVAFLVANGTGFTPLADPPFRPLPAHRAARPRSAD
jgi:thiamine biosynthesis lipoprotein ApbE